MRAAVLKVTQVRESYSSFHNLGFDLLPNKSTSGNQVDGNWSFSLYAIWMELDVFSSEYICEHKTVNLEKGTRLAWDQGFAISAKLTNKGQSTG